MKFSIITPSFNQLDWLRLCIASVADQVSPSSKNEVEVEHIIQDGGSAGIDLFSQQMKELYPNRDGYNLRFISEKDSGMYDALNKGFKQANGAIFAWINCDEQYLPNALTTIADYFKRNTDTDILLGDALLLNGEQELVSYRRIIKPLQWHTRLDHLHSLSCAMFFRACILNDMSPFNPRWRIIGDAVLVDGWVQQNLTFRTLRKPLSCYSLTGVNLSLEDQVAGEHKRWLQELSWPPGWFRWFVILHHRLRRLLNGAYLRHRIETAVYTHQSTQVRVVKSSLKLGWSWPSSPSHEGDRAL